MSEEHGEEPVAPEDAPPNAADPVAYKRQRQSQRRRRKEAVEFWGAVFANPVGRREMWAILEEAHAFEERFACGPNGYPQPDATWLNAGEQRFGFRLFRSWLRVCPDGVMLMIREHDPLVGDPKFRRTNR